MFNRSCDNYPENPSEYSKKRGNRGLRPQQRYAIIDRGKDDTMHRTAAILTLLLIIPAAVSGQGTADSARVDTIVVRPKPSCLTLPAEYYHTRIDYSLSMPDRPRTPNLSGFEVYRLSRMQCTIKGAGAGMTAGFMAGAFGEMAGAWNEKTAFTIAGALAVFGALYGGGVKADDDGWNLQIRLDKDNLPPGPTQLPRK
jgi:hypothetical protein